MFCGTAAGELFKPFVVFKAKHLMDNWVEAGPAGCGFAPSDSGWFNSYTFKLWFKTIYLPWAQDPVRKDEWKALIGLCH